MADDEIGATVNRPEPERQKKLRDTLSRTVKAAGTVAGEAAQKGKQVGGQLIQSAGETTQSMVGKVQRTLGEDYYTILTANPLVLDMLSRSDLLVENRELLSTAFNIPWTTTLLWSTAAGSTLSLQGQIADVMGQIFHYGPGHIKRWKEINDYMDSVSGVGHRLKWGHSIDHLPIIVEKFGIEGVPAYFLHLLQDFTTPAGIPIMPNAWDIKQNLEAIGLPKKVATGLVSISFASTLGALSVITLMTELRKFGEALAKKLKTRNYLKTAATALQNRDHNAAITNYQRALEIERNPAVLMVLGQVYMQRASTRLRAHQAFTEAITLLAERRSLTAPYSQAKLSIRGLAGIQALATADVLADIHPEHWNDHLRDLVNATVFSFSSSASEQAGQGDDLVPDMVVTPAHFSAAINYYLAARSACYYPLTEERQEVVVRNMRLALRSIGLVAQYDEERLRQPINTIRELWTMEVLPPNEIGTALANY